MTGFHGDVIWHLARRGVEAVVNKQTDVHPSFDVPVWGKVIVGITFVGFSFFLASLRYTLWGVLPALTAIETPQTTYVVKDEKSSNGADALAEDCLDEEVLVIQHRPITSKIRSTIKHLQDRAGFRARWRGVSLFLVYLMLHGLLTEFLQSQLINLGSLYAFGFHAVYGGRVVASVITTILLARLSLTWTHIVVSEPSSKAWFRRVPSHKAWKNVWASNAASDVACRLPIVLPALCASATGLTRLGDVKDISLCSVALRVVACFAIGIISFIGLSVPAYVTMIRVQASMLPEEHESIVPFDRTFAGRVIPEILGGSGAVGYLDAWKSFDRPARLRILKLMAKNIAIEIALHVFFALVIGCEVVALVGPNTIREITKEGRF